VNCELFDGLGIHHLFSLFLFSIPIVYDLFSSPIHTTPVPAPLFPSLHSVNWALPITIGALLNPSLPSLAVVCQPLPACVTNIKNAGAAILKAVWKILTVPLKIIWLCIKTILTKIGGVIMAQLNKFSYLTSRKEVLPKGVEVDEATKDSFGDEEEDDEDEDDGANGANGAKGAKVDDDKAVAGFGAAPIKEAAQLVPLAEAQASVWNQCITCNLRLILSLSLSLADCIFGFGITGFKIILSTIPQTGPSLLKCGAACLKTAISAVRPNSNQKAVAALYWQETCTPHTIGMCMLNLRATQCRAAWSG